MIAHLKYMRRTKLWQREHDQYAPRAGDNAPEFALCDVDGAGPFALAELRRERPVVLVFGSFT